MRRSLLEAMQGCGGGSGEEVLACVIVVVVVVVIGVILHITTRGSEGTGQDLGIERKGSIRSVSVAPFLLMRYSQRF